MKFMAQFQENKRPSGFVILSGAKDLCSARDPSLRSELAQDAKRRDDKPEAASFDSQNVFFEMYCPLRVPFELRNGLQVQDHLLDIRGRVRTTPGVRVALIGAF